MINKLWIPSPFYRVRGGYPLDMIVIHHIGSKNEKLYNLEGTITWFTVEEVHRNKETGKIENKVSAHYIIPRDTYKDNDVIYLVSDNNVAYHAGYSQWLVNGKLRKNINNYSIGIELEGDGNLIEYTDFQYDTLINLTKHLMKAFNIPENNIVGHEDIAPDRKVDPGRLFDWKRYREGINKKEALVFPPINITPAEIPKIEKDDEIFMESGEDNKGKKTNIISFFIELLLDILKVN